MVWKYWLSAIISVMVFIWVPSGYSQEDVSDRVGIRTVAVMSFGAFSIPDLSVDITGLVKENLEKQGLEVVSGEAFDAFLISRRIRGAEFLARPTIRAMGTVLNADALFYGSVDILRGGEDPQASISVQMVDCGNGRIVWANSISRTGSDYTTFLGLGKISSLDQLVKTAVEELLDGIPKTSRGNDLGIAPFEVIRADFSPAVIRGGQKTRVSLQVREILGKVRDIRAFVLDDEIELNTENGKEYSAIFEAPSIEGGYSLKLYITDRWNRLFSMDAMARLTVQNRAPDISLSLRNRRISPNNDGIRDYAFFIPEVLEPIRLREWRVEIMGADGRVIREERGFGVLPEGFVWRGVDDQYKQVEDGLYYCRLIAEDEAGNKTFTEQEEVVVDATPPRVELAIQAEDETGLVLVSRTDEVSNIGYWRLSIADEEGAEWAVANGKGPIPTTLHFDVAKKKANRMT